MYSCRMRPYEGSEKYIFISYAHKDSEAVWPLIDRLNDDGFRIWYDDGIAPGAEWPEYVANHLNNASAVIAFVTSNSADSANCRREITFSLSKNIPFISVMLEPTELSLGLELQLSAQRCILKHNYASDERFYETLKTAAIIAPCSRNGTSSDVHDDFDPAVSKDTALQKPAGKKRRWLIPCIAAVLLCAFTGVFFIISREAKAPPAPAAEETSPAPAAEETPPVVTVYVPEADDESEPVPAAAYQPVDSPAVTELPPDAGIPLCGKYDVFGSNFDLTFEIYDAYIAHVSLSDDEYFLLREKFGNDAALNICFEFGEDAEARDKSRMAIDDCFWYNLSEDPEKHYLSFDISIRQLADFVGYNFNDGLANILFIHSAQEQWVNQYNCEKSYYPDGTAYLLVQKMGMNASDIS